jgi:hypothetical protein
VLKCISEISGRKSLEKEKKKKKGVQSIPPSPADPSHLIFLGFTVSHKPTKTTA